MIARVTLCTIDWLTYYIVQSAFIVCYRARVASECAEEGAGQQ